MTLDFTAALRNEIAQIEHELERDIKFRRLRELRRLLELYDTAGETLSLTNEAGTSIEQNNQSRQVGRRTSPQRAQALHTIKLYLLNRSGPVPTREIFDHLGDLGISIGGENPLNNLSAMLSNSKEFVAFGRAGWQLSDEAEIDEKIYTRVCEVILADLESSELRSLHTDIENGLGISAEVDARLLSQTRSEIGRDLNQDEKRRLRAVFREMLSNIVK